MAAIRSALAMLGRRSCGSSGSSAAASIGGRGLEIHQVLRLAAPRAPPLPSLRPAAGRNLEGWRRFSTAGREQANKAEGGLRMWWQRAKNRVENANAVERSQAAFVCSAVSLGASTCYMLKIAWEILRKP